MAFSEDELSRIDEIVGDYCQFRSPVDLRDKIRVGYSVKGQGVLIYESRPRWDNPEEWRQSEFAKLRYLRTGDKWELYWKLASGRWLLYEPRSRSASLPDLIEEIDADPHGCFFG